MSSCKKLAVFPQLSGTCWFNAVLTSLFFSEHMKSLLKQKESSWGMSLKLKKIFRDILKRRAKPYEIKSHAYLFFKVITPEYILEKLNDENPTIFNHDPRKRDGYFNTLYLPRLLEFLGVHDTMHLDVVLKKDGTYNIYYSNIYNNYTIRTVSRNHDHEYLINHKDTPQLPPQKEHYDVVTLRFTEERHSKQNLYKKHMKQSELFGDEFAFAGQTFVHDSVLLTNFNINTCKKAHDIAGITCDGERYMYNGWMRYTKDKAMKKGGGAEAYPCEIIEHDWLRADNDFCLNVGLCKLDKASIKDISRQVCFNPMKGPRTYVLVNKAFTQRNTSEPLVKTTRVCPVGKIVNPATGRCVKVDGAIGKKLSKPKPKA